MSAREREKVYLKILFKEGGIFGENPPHFGLIFGDVLFLIIDIIHSVCENVPFVSKCCHLSLTCCCVVYIFTFTEMPSETALRTFILVAKSLQNLANLIEFGTKVGAKVHFGARALDSSKNSKFLLSTFTHLLIAH